MPRRSTLVHVDCHSGNIMVQNGKLIFVDMADVSIGHPLFLIMVVKHAHIKYDAAMELINRQRQDLLPHIEEAVSLFKRADEFFKK